MSTVTLINTVWGLHTYDRARAPEILYCKGAWASGYQAITNNIHFHNDE